MRIFSADSNQKARSGYRRKAVPGAGSCILFYAQAVNRRRQTFTYRRNRPPTGPPPRRSFWSRAPGRSFAEIPNKRCLPPWTPETRTAANRRCLRESPRSPSGIPAARSPAIFIRRTVQRVGEVDIPQQITRIRIQRVAAGVAREDGHKIGRLFGCDAAHMRQFMSNGRRQQAFGRIYIQICLPGEREEKTCKIQRAQHPGKQHGLGADGGKRQKWVLLLQCVVQCAGCVKIACVSPESTPGAA